MAAVSSLGQAVTETSSTMPKGFLQGSGKWTNWSGNRRRRNGNESNDPAGYERTHGGKNGKSPAREQV
jgi:hypothetical protein